MSRQAKIAVIGAGLAGMRLVQLLSDKAGVTVFEKSRGIGGRMSTRRAEEMRFDHGAQYFTARGDAFREFLAPYLANGTVARWELRLVHLGPQGVQSVADDKTRYVASPGMNSLCKAMAGQAQVALASRVAHIRRKDAGWALETTGGDIFDGFDMVLCTAPSVQAQALMPEEFSGHDALAMAQMQGCYSLMLGFETAPVLSWDAARVSGSPLAWIAANHRKPGRSGAEMLCQSDNQWAEDNMERDQDAVRTELMAVFSKITGVDAAAAHYASLHRWRYAKVSTATGAPCLFDAQSGLGAAGDWCGGGRVESAFDSAEALGAAVLAEIS